MLRNIIGRGGAVAAGGAAAAAPTTAHCRAQSQHRGAVQTKDKDKDAVIAGPSSARQVDQEWLVADVCSNDVFFGPEEITEAINTVMGVRGTPSAVSSDVAIHEVDHPESDSESSGADANEAIAAAGMQLAAYNAQQDHFFAALHNMVNRPEVQRVLLTALLEDPNFQGLLQDRNQVAAADALLPAAARAGLQAQGMTTAHVEEVTEDERAFLHMAARVADRIMHAAKGVRDAAANVLIKLGFEIHNLLGRPLKPRGKASTDGQVGTPGNSVGAPEWLPKLLMTVGAAVIALLLFKRMRAI